MSSKMAKYNGETSNETRNKRGKGQSGLNREAAADDDDEDDDGVTETHLERTYTYEVLTVSIRSERSSDVSNLFSDS
jgi:hypothetical protein